MSERVLSNEAPVAAWYVAASLTLGCAGPPAVPRLPPSELLGRGTDGMVGREVASRHSIAYEPIVACESLTSAHCKTWTVTDVVWGDQAARSPFREISFVTDGHWHDSSGVTGIWRMDFEPPEILFELDDFTAVICCRVVELTPTRLALEFATYSPGMILTLTPNS